MTDQPKSEQPAPDLAERGCLFQTSAGLLLLFMALFEKYGTLALFPVLLGAGGLVSFLLPQIGKRFGAIDRARHAMPILLILALVVVDLLAGYPPWASSNFFDVSDMLAAGGLLVYLAGQYRLFGLRTNIAPIDTRARLDRTGGDLPVRRPSRAVTRGEWIGLGVVLPAAVIAAQLLWWWVVVGHEWSPEDYEYPRAQFNMRDTVWRLFSLFWLLGTAALLIRGAAGLLWSYRLTRDEARLYGHEIVWAETRGEQRRVNRWRAWVRRRRARQSGRLA